MHRDSRSRKVEQARDAEESAENRFPIREPALGATLRR